MYCCCTAAAPLPRCRSDVCHALLLLLASSPSSCPRSPPARSIERSNLFEQLCALLSKTAFPVSGPLAAVHLQSLDGILAILAALADGTAGVSDTGAAQQRAARRLLSAGGSGADAVGATDRSCSALQPPPTAHRCLLIAADPSLLAPPADPSEVMDIWAGLVRGCPLALGPMLPPGGEEDPAEVARVEKFLKGRLVSAAEHFNRSEKKGFQYLQVLLRGLLSLLTPFGPFEAVRV